MKLLTPEDKKVLRIASKYLKSLGNSEGTIDFYIDEGFREPSNLYLRNFSNDYTTPIPDFLVPVIVKIYDFCSKRFDTRDDVSYAKFEIIIDTDTKEVRGMKYWSYYEPSDTNGTSWDIQEEEYKEDLENIFKKLEEMGMTEEVVLDYNGSGDSGYIENYFRGNEYQAPAVVENWCYDQLENLHGGWEINEGSEGYFTFDVANKVIHLEHTFNEEVHKEDTLYEESFDK
jgi:hypothetical protein